MKRKLLTGLIIFACLVNVFSQNYKFYALSTDKSNTQPVYLCELDSVTGKITILERYEGVSQGNYFALAPDASSLLVTSKNPGGDQGGLVQYSVAEDGSLTYMTSRFKPGTLPCYVSFTPDGEYVLSANYRDDEISLYGMTSQMVTSEIDHIVKPDLSKGHYIRTDPSGKFVHAVFLGLDKVFNYTIVNDAFSENQDQASFSLPEGYGPRHMAFHPNNRFVYILNETHSSVTACSYDTASGVIQQIQDISMLPDGFVDKTNAAAIRIHPGGRFLYASNRGHNSIAVYEITDDGTLIFVEHETEGVNFPRDFNISPDGKMMIIANQKGASIMSLRIDEATGELSNTNNTLAIQAPLAIAFLEFPEADTDTTGTVLGVDKSTDLFSLYPNPATDKLRVEAAGSGIIQSLVLFNSRGQQLKKISNINETTINISNLPGGQYLLFGTNGTRSYTRSFVIRK